MKHRYALVLLTVILIFSLFRTASQASNNISKVSMPQLQEIDNILAFLNQPLPKLMNGNNFDVVSYNIRLLVSYAKPKEALAYAQKNARVFTVNPAEGFYKYLQDIIEFDSEFHKNLNKVLKARNNRDHHGLVASLQAISNMNYDIGLSSYYTYGIELNKAVAVYSNMIKDVNKSLNQAIKYRDAVVAENNANTVKNWGGFTGTQKTHYGSSPSEYTDFLSNFDNLCKNGSVQEFNEVFKKIPVNRALNSKGITPLMRASMQNKTKIMNLLFNLGAKVDLQDTNNYTALDYAIDNYQYEAAQLLFKHGAKASRLTWNLAVTQYIMIEEAKLSTAILETLETGNDDTRKISKIFGASAVFGMESARMMNLLLKNGMSINQTVNDNGDTPLILATRKGKFAVERVVKDLLKRGANPNIKNNKGERALDIARNRNNSTDFYDGAVIEVLMKAMNLKSLKD